MFDLIIITGHIAPCPSEWAEGEEEMDGRARFGEIRRALAQSVSDHGPLERNHKKKHLR